MNILTAIFDFFRFLGEGYIELHKMSFGLLSETEWWYQYDGLLGAILNVIFAIMAIVVVLCLDAIIILVIFCLIRRISIIIRVKEITYHNVTGKVNDNIDLILVRKLDKEGKVIEETLELPE